jgi:hypothetical protein
MAAATVVFPTPPGPTHSSTLRLAGIFKQGDVEPAMDEDGGMT